MPVATPAPTLGERLQRCRLEARVHRVELVVAALEDQRQAREAAGFVPEPLQLAIRDFRRELHELQDQLALGDACVPVG